MCSEIEPILYEIRCRRQKQTGRTQALNEKYFMSYDFDTLSVCIEMLVYVFRIMIMDFIINLSSSFRSKDERPSEKASEERKRERESKISEKRSGVEELLESL